MGLVGVPFVGQPLVAANVCFVASHACPVICIQKVVQVLGEGLQVDVGLLSSP